ncbi:hypothetical protein V8J88_22140 [Massilia sp. W12]|uniref:Kelch repeat-containing protein n=1 Tax=Massilia sp. W12 TaxID=3126507 RepID=UPI0030D46A0B
MSFNYLLPVLALLSACASPPSSTALQWQSAPPMQFARAAHAVAADDSGIYVLGGTGVGGKPVLEVEHFDGRQWRVISQLPAGGLNAPTAVMHDGQLWLIGGFFTDSNIPGAQVWRFDPQIRRWQQETPLPAPRGGHASAIYQGRLHVFGGGNDERTLAPRVKIVVASSDLEF